MKNWYSPIMMERFGRGVVISWRENNIKNEEQGGEEEVEDGIPKATFGACVRDNSSDPQFNQDGNIGVKVTLLPHNGPHSSPNLTT
ncbi:hypothetical protein J6590_070061 [Homalodisca vitripennis]|nr:hypothetical protein J6590_070061 [Homalodisca vitripennis]